MPVSTRHPSYELMAPKVTKTELAFTGDVQGYVPRLSNQSEKAWQAMVDRPAYYNVTERTTQALIGALVRKPHAVEGLAGDEPYTDEATFGVFLQHTYKHLMLGGRVGLHVDYDEAAGSPKLIAYPFDNIINWADDFVVIEECVIEPDEDDPFKLISVPQWRELRLIDGLYTVRLWRAVGREEYKVIDQQEPTIRGKRLDYLPFWFVTPYDCSHELHSPPLATLAALNVSHYRLAVDVYHGAHFHALPTPWIAGDLRGTEDGRPQQAVQIGTETFLHLDPGGTVGYLEPTGNGLPFIQSLQKDVEEQMYASGSRLLTVKKGVESAEALQLRSGSESATLDTLAKALEHALSQALITYNAWAGSSTEPTITLNRDFTASVLDPAQIKALLETYAAGVITIDTLLQRLFEGEIVADVEEEKKGLQTPEPEAEAEAR